MRACTQVCAHAQNASQRGRRVVHVRVRADRRAARDGDLHQGITVHMYSHLGSTVPMYIMIYTRVRVYTGMRALAEYARARAWAWARARRELASTNCVSLRTFYIDVYLCMNVGMYGCRIVCLCMCVCV